MDAGQGGGKREWGGDTDVGESRRGCVAMCLIRDKAVGISAKQELN